MRETSPVVNVRSVFMTAPLTELVPPSTTMFFGARRVNSAMTESGT
jgi:hypothetical protein